MNKTKLFLSLIVAVGLLKISYSQIKTRSYMDDDLLFPIEHSVDMQNMKLEVAFEPTKGLVNGTITHTFMPIQKTVDTLFLEGPGIRVKEAKLDESKVAYKSDSAGITFFFKPSLAEGSTHHLTITYEATPRKGIYFIGWNDSNNLSRKQIWTQGQGVDNRFWFPSYDNMNDKLTTELFVKFDSQYKVLSNGLKIKEKDNKDGTTTWHYKMQKPHTTYLVMLGIGKFDIKETQSKSGVPMHLWYYPEWKDRVEKTYVYSEQMIDFFEKEIGVKYPWESYSQIPVQDFMYGAMENTTATLFGDFFFVDDRGFLDRNYVAVNAHELAHQWFGDMVTARSSSHAWLQETFATHYNWLFEKEVFGQDHFDWNRRNATNAALLESEKNLKPIMHSSAGSVRIYPKGAFVLNMIKYVIGREQYNKAIKYYLNKHGYKNVDTEDLLVAFHETLGLSLDWFWEQWIYHGGEPFYEVTYQDITTDGKRYAEFSVTQIHEMNRVVGLFKMPFVFEVYYKDGTKDNLRVWIEKQQHTVKVPNPMNKDIDFVLFDPNSEVMKKITFKKSFEMLKAQALKAEHMLDRYDAVVAMENIALDKKRDVLIEVFNNEKFHAVKGAVIEQLIADEQSSSKELIRKAIVDEDVQVRKALIQNTILIPSDLIADYEKLLKEPSYQLLEEVLETMSFNNPSKTKEYLEITKGETGIKGMNIRIKWLEVAYNNSKEQAYVDELVNYVSSSYEFLARNNAAMALKRLNYFNKTLMVNLFDGLLNPNIRLSQPCGEVLKHFYQQTAYKKMISDYYKSKQRQDWEEDIIEKYIAY